jgi:hypothetical protein
MRARTIYEQTTTVTCSDNGKSNIADVINFIPEQRLTVSLNRSIKLEMTYNKRNQLYVANQTGLEFVSSGPKKIEIKGIGRY